MVCMSELCSACYPLSSQEHMLLDAQNPGVFGRGRVIVLSDVVMEKSFLSRFSFNFTIGSFL